MSGLDALLAGPLGPALAIAAMAVVTYACRVSGVLLMRSVRITPTVERALAALHAEWRHPGTFGGLLLQSGSFFLPDVDGHESGHGGWSRITGFVAEVQRATRAPSRLPVAVVFGTAEENATNNRQMADALRRLGLDVRVGEVRDGHTWTCWRDLLDPHLLAVVGE